MCYDAVIVVKGLVDGYLDCEVGCYYVLLDLLVVGFCFVGSCMSLVSICFVVVVLFLSMLLGITYRPPGCLWVIPHRNILARSRPCKSIGLVLRLLEAQWRSSTV